jgi:toxin ParE1/3/4
VNPLFTIRYLSTAQRDLLDIFEYIKKDRPQAASGLLDKFDKSIAQLAANPKLGIIPKDDRLKRLGYRVLVVDKYLVFYVLKSKKVQIRRVIHGARKYHFLL